MATTNHSTDLRLSITDRQILGIAFPIGLSMLVPQINFVVNNIFLAGLGEAQLATAGITGVYYLIFAVAGNGLNNGLQTLISRRAGENRLNEIGNLFMQGVFLALLYAAIAILLTWVITPMVLSWAVHSAHIHEQAVVFLRIRIWGLPFLYVYQMRNALLVGTNQSRLLIYGTLAETITNIFFDYSLIYGHFGFPRLGFNGAAFASIIAEATGMLTLFAVIHRKKIYHQIQLYQKPKIDKSIMGLIARQSLPIIIQYSISLASWEFFYILIEHHGERALAISNAMRNIFGIIGVYTWAFAATCNTMVSNIIGQGKQDMVLYAIGRIVRLSTGLSLALCLILNCFPQYFLYLYGQDPAFIQEAIPVVRIVSVALVMMSFASICLNGVTGTGKTRVNMYIEMVAISLYSIYVYVVLEYLHLPITYGWASEWLYWISMFTPAILYLRSGRWKGHRI